MVKYFGELFTQSDALGWEKSQESPVETALKIPKGSGNSLNVPEETLMFRPEALRRTET